MAETAEIRSDHAPVQTRDEVIARIRDHEPAIRKYHATALYLFGSAARDEMTADSDIDVFIDYERDGSFTFIEWFDLEELLVSILGRPVDFMTRYSLHPMLKDRIEKSCVRVI